jgi:alpha-1,3-mannosyl-glycoprotein beta-1,2-N-acetylglucosaminyltransferase
MVASMKRLKEELMIESQKCEEAQQAALKSEKRAEELLIALNTLAANNKRELIEKTAVNDNNEKEKNRAEVSSETQFNSDQRSGCHTFPKYPIAVVVFTYARPQYLRRCLDSIFKYIPKDNFVVIISQDDAKSEVTKTIQEYRRHHEFLHLQHLNRTLPPIKNSREFPAYYYIAQHYHWALSHVFDVLKYESVIILEEDLEISPDFFTYMAATQWLLWKDPTLMCVSAWNDNGSKKHIKDHTKLYRSNFFPGLGWMMRRELWNEWKHKWPPAYWDDWIREPQQRKERDCIRPEVSRTYTFGESGGASNGQFFNDFLRPIVLNTINVPWFDYDLSFLLKEKYDVHFKEELQKAELASDFKELEKAKKEGKTPLMMIYNDLDHLRQLSAHFGLLHDPKAGVPRTGYMGVVSFWDGDSKVHLAPRKLVNELLSKNV